MLVNCVRRRGGNRKAKIGVSRNGRYAERLLSIAEESMAERLDTERSDLPERELFEILPEDIPSSRSWYGILERQDEK